MDIWIVDEMASDMALYSANRSVGVSEKLAVVVARPKRLCQRFVE